MDGRSSNLIDYVIHYKKKLDKSEDLETLLHAIHKLEKIQITSKVLEATHIGKTVRNLSKRNDDVGEKAKALLDKWRHVFVNMESARNFKEKNIGSKDNIEKSTNKQYLIKVKTNHHLQKKASHELKEEKHKKNSLHHTSSKQPLENLHHLNSLSKSNQSLGEFEMMSHFNEVDFLNDLQASIRNSDDSQETFHLDDRKKNSPSSEPHAVSSSKRKLTTGEKSETYMYSNPKKIKSEKQSNSDNEEKEKHRIAVDKDENLKKEKSFPLHSKKAKPDGSKIKNITEPEKSKPKVKTQSVDEFTSSGVSFEDCLGFSDIVAVKKKKNSKSQSSSKKSSDTVPVKNQVTNIKIADKKAIDNVNVSKKSSNCSKEQQSGDVLKKSKMFDAFKANSSFSPMQSTFASQNQNLQKKNKEDLTNEDVIKFTSSRKEKTAIYSGRKSYSKSVPSLAQCSYRVLIENIDILGALGGAPYELLKPILERCTPKQLFTIERYNPHLLDETNELWELHCKNEYKSLSPLEHETWRDVYLRGYDEREQKLKNVTANISASRLKATPARQVKLAFIDSYVKPPRDVLRRQTKHRVLESEKKISKPVNAVKPEITSKANAKKMSSASCSSTSCSSASSDHFVANKIIDLVKTNVSLHHEDPDHHPSSKEKKKSMASPVIDPTASDKEFAALSLAARKPKVAPLMAKTLKAMKQCFRR